jgi:hypothetical protein
MPEYKPRRIDALSSIIMEAVDARVAKETAEVWTLGMLIQALKRYDPALPVVIAPTIGGISLGGAASYRGYYEMLAFEPTEEEHTVAELLVECEAANGKTFTGYKGGDFTMGINTKVWVSAWNDSSGIGIVDVEACTLFAGQSEADVVLVKVRKFE